VQDVLAAGALRRQQLRPELQADAVAQQGAFDHRRRVAILARQEPRPAIDQRHLAAEAGERLRHLAADRSGADHHEAARQLLQPEDRLVGQRLRLRQAGAEWQRRPSAGGDHGAAEVEPGAADLDGAAIDELPFAEKHIDAEIAEPRHAVDRREVGAQAAHAAHHGGEIARTGGGRRAEGRGCAGHLRPGPRCAEDPLGGDAADVQAIAAHHMSLDERHLRPQGGAGRRRHQTTGAGADHHQVVAILRRRIDVAFRVDVRQVAQVVLVERADHRFGAVHDVDPVCSASARRARRVTNRVTTIVAASPRPSTA
jgi:hypothetical protein